MRRIDESMNIREVVSRYGSRLEDRLRRDPSVRRLRPCSESELDGPPQGVVDLTRYVRACVDPTEHGYTSWILARYAEGRITNADEFDRIRQLLVDFDRLRSRIPRERASERDVWQYPDVNSLEKTVSDLKSTETNKERRRKERERIRDEYVVHYESPDYLIVEPKTKEAACFWGKSTHWCISATKSRNDWDEYSPYGRFLFLIDRKTDERWAIQPKNVESRDQDDDWVDPEWLLRRYPALRRVLTPREKKLLWMAGMLMEPKKLRDAHLSWNDWEEMKKLGTRRHETLFALLQHALYCGDLDFFHTTVQEDPNLDVWQVLDHFDDIITLPSGSIVALLEFLLHEAANSPIGDIPKHLDHMIARLARHVSSGHPTEHRDKIASLLFLLAIYFPDSHFADVVYDEIRENPDFATRVLEGYRFDVWNALLDDPLLALPFMWSLPERVAPILTEALEGNPELVDDFPLELPATVVDAILASGHSIPVDAVRALRARAVHDDSNRRDGQPT